jgi:hypothetical protein
MTSSDEIFGLADLRDVTGQDVCRSLTHPCRVPLWLVNAAGSGARDLTSWLKTPPNDALRTSFEMSAFGQGSGLFGFTLMPPLLPLRDAVGSSAAFFDRDQRQVGSGWIRTLVSASLSAFNLEWGSDIQNYNVSDQRPAWARVTPLPLYHVSREQERYAPTIHLSDGGNTDNLGVLAAIRRGAKNIVVVAATGDGKGEMRSLCRAKNHLELDGTYRVELPDLLKLNDVCSVQIGEHERVVWGDAAIKILVCDVRKSQSQCVCTEEAQPNCRWKPNPDAALGYDMWAWTHPFVMGRVVRNRLPSDSLDSVATLKDNQTVIANVALLKPGIDTQRALESQFVAKDEAAPKSLCDIPTNFATQKIAACGDSHAMPCAALAFAAANNCKADYTAANKKDVKRGTFPQHGVEITTLNSSYTIFGAYFDLARHYANQLSSVQANDETVLGTRNRDAAPGAMTPRRIEPKSR